MLDEEVANLSAETVPDFRSKKYWYLYKPKLNSTGSQRFLMGGGSFLWIPQHPNHLQVTLESVSGARAASRKTSLGIL
jgi:hypothetical protein